MANRPSILVACVLLTAASAVSAEQRDLIRFDQPAAVNQWQAVNDGVMGGRSAGSYRINSNSNLEFFGRLSLANNGGFASVRTRRMPLNLSSDDVIVLRVFGDGRQYSFNLYPSRRRTAFSYRAAFGTLRDRWAVVRMPVSTFRATSYGRTVIGATLNPANIDGVGILLGDKRPGPFRLEVASISIESAD